MSKTEALGLVSKADLKQAAMALQVRGVPGMYPHQYVVGEKVLVITFDSENGLVSELILYGNLGRSLREMTRQPVQSHFIWVPN